MCTSCMKCPRRPEESNRCPGTRVTSSCESTVWPGLYHVNQDDFKLPIPLPPTPACWDYRGTPPWPVYTMLELESDALCMLSTLPTEPCPQAQSVVLQILSDLTFMEKHTHMSKTSFFFKLG